MIASPLAARPKLSATLLAGSLVVSASLGSAGSARAAPPSAPEPKPTPLPKPGATPDPEPAHQVDVLVRVLPPDDRILRRLRAELELIGLGSAELELDARAGLGADLLDQLEGTAAEAAIEIVISQHRVDLWVADKTTGKTLTRRLDLALSPELAEPRPLATAAIELLRASRLELGGSGTDAGEAHEDERGAPADQAREGERPPIDTPPSLPQRPLRGALSLAPLLGGSPGELGITTHIELAGRWAPLDRFALRVNLWVPTLGNEARNDEGRARVFIGMAYVEPQLRLPGGAPWFHPDLGLGLGGGVTGIVGSAAAGNRSNTEVLGAFAGYAHLGLGFAVVPRVWVRLDGYTGMLLPTPQVFILDERVARWGFPFGMGSFGLEVWI